MYKGKIVAVSGRVIHIETLAGEGCIGLANEGMFSTVTCWFEQPDSLSDLRKGDSVTVKEKVLGLQAKVNLDHCSLQ